MVRSRGVAVALAGFLTAACGGDPEPSPAEPVSCTDAHLRVTAGPWSGAVGSRWSEVLVEHVGDGACLLPPAPVVGLVDAAERLLLESTPESGCGPVLLVPDTVTTFAVRYSNACERAVAVPIALYLALDAGPVEVSDSVIASSDDLPPCSAPDESSAIETSRWGEG